jgi:hypothetical protein
MTFQIKTAGLVDPELEARWTTRRAARQILQAILRVLSSADPVLVEEIIRTFSSKPRTRFEQP